MEYTKGEWKARLDFGERQIYIENDNGIEVIACDVRHWNIPIILAAPEMYEALIQCSTILLNHGFGQFTCTKLAQKALAKAKEVRK